MKLHTEIDLNPLHWVGSLLGGAAHTIAGSILGVIAKAMMQAVNQLIVAVGTLWVQVPTPDLVSGGTTSTTASPTVSFIQGQLHWYVTALAVGGVLAGCLRMAFEQRAQPGIDLLRGLAVYVAVSGCGLTVIAISTSAMDSFSTWIISDSAGGAAFGTELAAMLALGPAGGTLATMLVIIFGLIAVLASAVQIFLMVVRGAMLVLMAGVLPATAAFTNTEAGRTWFRRSCSWLVAFILYKPAAAIVYATAFKLAGTSVFAHGGVIAVISGLTLMILALLALPALMRFVMPMVGATAAGGMAGLLGAGAGIAAMAAMPTGAVALAGAGGAAGFAGGGAAGAAAGIGGGGGGGNPSGAAPASTGSTGIPDAGAESSRRSATGSSSASPPPSNGRAGSPDGAGSTSASGPSPVGAASANGGAAASTASPSASGGGWRASARRSMAGGADAAAPAGATAATGAGAPAGDGGVPARGNGGAAPSSPAPAVTGSDLDSVSGVSGPAGANTVPAGQRPGLADAAHGAVARSLADHVAGAVDGAIPGAQSTTSEDPSGSERTD